MSDIGILYTEANRLAVTEDRKWMTRRLPASFKEINEKPDEWELDSLFNSEGDPSKPYPQTRTYAAFLPAHNKDVVNVSFAKLPYAVGDMMYIKEPHYLYGYWEGIQLPGALFPYKWRFRADKSFGVWFPDNLPPSLHLCKYERGPGWFKRSPLFMFKEDARHWQRVTGVNVERLQSISEDDVIAEGCQPRTHMGPCRIYTPAKDVYHTLWDSIHGPGAWELNPWVPAVSFERLAKEEV